MGFECSLLTVGISERSSRSHTHSPANHTYLLHCPAIKLSWLHLVCPLHKLHSPTALSQIVLQRYTSLCCLPLLFPAVSVDRIEGMEISPAANSKQTRESICCTDIAILTCSVKKTNTLPAIEESTGTHLPPPWLNFCCIHYLSALKSRREKIPFTVLLVIIKVCTIKVITNYIPLSVVLLLGLKTTRFQILDIRFCK